MSVEDPRLTVWAREQAQAAAQFSTEHRVRIIERTIGIASKAVRDDLGVDIAAAAAAAAAAQASANGAQSDVDTLTTDVATELSHRLAVTSFGTPWVGLQMAFGVTNVVFGGGSATASGAVAHGLGTTPLFGLCTAQSQTGSGSVNAQIHSGLDYLNFTLWIESVSGFQPGAGITVPVAWIVMG